MKKKYLRKMLFEQFRRNSTNLTKFLLSFSVSFEIGSGVRLWSRAIEFEIRSIFGPDSARDKSLIKLVASNETWKSSFFFLTFLTLFFRFSCIFCFSSGKHLEILFKNRKKKIKVWQKLQKRERPRLNFKRV